MANETLVETAAAGTLRRTAGPGRASRRPRHRRDPAGEDRASRASRRAAARRTCCSGIVVEIAYLGDRVGLQGAARHGLAS